MVLGPRKYLDQIQLSGRPAQREQQEVRVCRCGADTEIVSAAPPGGTSRQCPADLRGGREAFADG